ncbi:MAG: hypothetical protein HQK86_04970 [Nitrospinae bacterium]|nr:hypothetical protein [Nitrospinota bacterium]MBF0633174.1 hypothetical protein [Nitrospinota bacterium]
MSGLTGSFVIHIGQAKCGSTALQNFLYVNNKSLQRNGYYYPAPIDGSRSHGVIALWLQDQWMPLSTGSRFEMYPQFNISPSSDPLFPWGEAHVPGLTAIFSSEGFFEIDPLFMARYFPSNDTKIIVYFREQLNFLRSGYAQEVQSRKIYLPFNEFANLGWRLDYFSEINAWSSVYGKNNIMPRVYERGNLLDADICKDFVGLLGISDTSDFSFSFTQTNPTIGGSLLKYKLLLNRVSEWDERTLLFKTFHALGDMAIAEERFRSPLVVPDDLAQAIRGKYKEPNRALFEMFFPDLGGFNIGRTQADRDDEALTIKDFEYINMFFKEYKYKDTRYQNYDVVDAHYKKMKEHIG